jgi:tetratricopeptide (TPR) repeat protein
MLRAHVRRKALGTAVRACGLAVAVVVLISMSSVQAAETCTPVIATVVSIQGGVELRRSPTGRSEAAWQAAELNVALCAGDTIRTHERSRAALLLTNETTLRLDQRTTLTLAAPGEDKASLLDLATGALHVITRTSRPFRVRTPFVNANVEGTEFLVTVGAESASVAVYEGRVTADNERGSVALNSGERAIAARNSAPRKEVVVRPRDAVQWTLYFPTIFDYRLGVRIAGAPGESALQESIELYRKGKLVEAIARLENVPEGMRNPRFLTYRAGLLLLVGRLDEAKPDIERALALDARSSDAYSLQAVIAVVENDKDLALSLANKAVEADPASPTARIALSYAQQAQFKIEQALASVQKAVDLDPQNALAWARLAELEMSIGNLDRALDAAKRAAELNPELAKTQTVLGFAYLTRINTRAAKAAFEKAIELDSADPLARLGLGLAKIRDGDLEGGRREIEIATSLDPGTSLIRSYLGKAYYEEKRDKLAGTQFDLAKQLDPRDPTAWFYDAIREQTLNQPVEALRDLNQAIKLNDNRAVYRSQLLLDQDLAARSASLARIYNDLGFGQLALIEGYKALAADPGNYSAHRFLADAYLSQPRHQIARVSEVLQAQLWQPLNITPVPPQLGEDKLFVLNGAGPARAGFNEFTPLFTRNQNTFQIDGLIGSNKTRGDQLVFAGIHDNVSYSLGQFHLVTDGFGPGNHATKTIYDIFLQAAISDRTSMQLEYRWSDSDQSQVILDFDPVFRSTQTSSEKNESLRLGLRHDLSPRSSFVISTIYQHVDALTSLEIPAFDFSGVIEDLHKNPVAVEAQHLYRGDRFHVRSGVGYFRQRFTDFVNSHLNLYSYARWYWPDFQIDVGLDGDLIESLGERRKELNPKLGLTLTGIPNTIIRLAAFRDVKRPLIGNQTVEPTELAGFNQFFDEINATSSYRAGLGIDHKIADQVFLGAELTARRLKVPPVDFSKREYAHRGYVYYAPQRWLALSADYFYELFDTPAENLEPNGFVKVKTQRLPLAVNLFGNSGISFRFASTYVNQQANLLAITGGDEVNEKNIFWETDAALTYRLPGRLGLLALGVRNLFNREIRFRETDPATPLFAPRRFTFARVSLSF